MLERQRRASRSVKRPRRSAKAMCVYVYVATRCYSVPHLALALTRKFESKVFFFQLLGAASPAALRYLSLCWQPDTIYATHLHYNVCCIQYSSILYAECGQ